MPYVVVRKGCTFVLLLYYRSYWEFEEHSINFLGANNEKIYQFADGSGMRSCQLYLRGTERNVPQRDEVKIGVTH